MKTLWGEKRHYVYGGLFLYNLLFFSAIFSPEILFKAKWQKLALKKKFYLRREKKISYVRIVERISIDISLSIWRT